MTMADDSSNTRHDRSSQLRRFGFVLRKTWRRLVGPSNRHVERLYEEHDYLEAYARHTDIRVRRDPHAAIGADWFRHGKHQLEFLTRHGLERHHTLLDIGCGTLRAGRHFMRYLDPGHYTGADISKVALAYARKLVKKQRLTDRKPRLLLNATKRLTFDFVPGERFDFLNAYSVFTHLNEAHVAECFEHLDHVMHDKSVFFFSYNAAPQHHQSGIKDFEYPFAFFEELARRHGFAVEDLSAEFEDPGTQQMVKLTRAS